MPEARSKRPATGLATVPSRPLPTPVMNPWNMEGVREGRRERERERERKERKKKGYIEDGKRGKGQAVCKYM